MAGRRAAATAPMLNWLMLWRIGFVSVIILAGVFGIFEWQCAAASTSRRRGPRRSTRWWHRNGLPVLGPPPVQAGAGPHRDPRHPPALIAVGADHPAAARLHLVGADAAAVRNPRSRRHDVAGDHGDCACRLCPGGVGKGRAASDAALTPPRMLALSPRCATPPGRRHRRPVHRFLRLARPRRPMTPGNLVARNRCQCRLGVLPAAGVTILVRGDAIVRIAAAALIGVLVGGSVTPALAQGQPGVNGTGAAPAGEVPGSVVPGRDKLGSPPCLAKMPGDERPSPSLSDPDKPGTPSVPGPVPGRDKLGSPPMPGQPVPRTGGADK